MMRIPTRANLAIFLSAVHWLVLLGAIGIYGKQVVVLQLFFASPSLAALLFALSGGPGGLKNFFVELLGSGQFLIFLTGLAYAYYHIAVIVLGLFSLLRGKGPLAVKAILIVLVGLSLITLLAFLYLGFNWNWT